jgi:hypothetical protein
VLAESGRWQISQVNGAEGEEEEVTVTVAPVLLIPQPPFGGEAEGRTIERYLSPIEGNADGDVEDGGLAGVELESVGICVEPDAETLVEIDVASSAGTNLTRFLLIPAPKTL